MAKQERQPKLWKDVSVQFKKGTLRGCLDGFECGCEWAAYRLSHWALLEVLEYVGKLSLLVALIVWVGGWKERKQVAEDSKKSRHYVAWQTINSAVGKPGNAGRSDALQELNDDGVALYGVSLNGGAFLFGSRLTNALLIRADLSGGTYVNVNFSGAKFYQSSWNGAIFEGCDFRGADFKSVSLTNVTFEGCNFAGVNFDSSGWTGVAFYLCNFAYANFSSVRIGTDVREINGNLFGASNASPEFITWASQHSFDFTNVVTFADWTNAARQPKIRQQSALGLADFQAWASNQFVNNPEGWAEWRRTNLNKP